MADFRDRTTALVTWIIIGVLLVGTLITTGFFWWLGDWEHYGPALTLALRIVWGSALVGCLAAALTRVTIFGWAFRRWFRPIEKRGLTEPPWPKSGAASFAITVSLVSLLGVACVATAVMWILRDAVGEWVMWLVIKLTWGAWWVLVITMVLIRVALFRRGMIRAAEKARAVSEEAPKEAPKPPEPAGNR
jgi:hypothetical protein